MKGLLTGILLGVGIGCLLAPMRGEEMRRLLNEQFLGGRANVLAKQFIPTDLSQIRNGLGDLTRFALSAVKTDDITLSGLTQVAISSLMKIRVPVSLNDLAGFASSATRKTS